MGLATDDVADLSSGSGVLRRPASFSPEFAAVLGETAEQLLLDADPDTLCQAVFQLLREPFGVDVYFHYLLSADGTALELTSAGGQGTRGGLGSRMELGQGVCGTVAQRGESMYLPDVDARTDRMTAFIRSLGVRAYGCYPLILRGTLLGTLSFGSTTRASHSPQEQELFTLVSRQVTLATDRRVQNEKLRQLERLATAGRLSATLAHEVNNPLESLGNLLYLLRTDIPAEEKQKLLALAQGQVEQLTQTAQRTLRMFRGQRETAQEIDLSEFVRDLICGMTLPNHVRLENHIENSLRVRANPGELRQVLFNLLTNAAHFTPRGAPVTLTVHAAGDQAEIRVRDEGEGISEKSRAQLFQPFYTTRADEGTGVGLWLSREMLERAGGQLTFESEPTVKPGTEFIATLPLIRPEPAA